MVQSNVYRNALPSQSTLHEYRLESVLGAGGFGVTYLAWDTNLEKNVAIKEYLPNDLAMRASDGSIVPLSTDAENGYKWGLERYILEARTLARFSHPNIVRVNRYFEANGTGYMVMDYERGEPLAAFLKRTPRPDEGFLKRMLAPLLEGLRAVHAAGFLHRDIKPDNIFLRADGTPVLIDFGAARQSVGGATKTLTAVLTPGYAPLEQYHTDGHQGPWTDVYALAGVLYRAVTDEPPPDAVTRLKADRVGEVLARSRDRYSESFLKALQWALAPEEKKRPQSVEEWRRALFDAPASALAVSATAVQEAATVRVAPQSARPAPGAMGNAGARSSRSPPPSISPGREGSPWLNVFGLVVVAVVAIGFWHKHRVDQERARHAEETAVEPPVTPVATDVSARAQPASTSPAPQDEAADGPMQRLRHEAEAQFRSADANGDGYLSQSEVRSRFPFMAREFGRVDSDGDGRISFDEFLAFRVQQLERRSAKKAPSP